MPRLHDHRRRVPAVTILVGIVMLLVPALAWMQYQWLGQLSTAERERMQRTLRTAAAQFATEFDSEMSRTLASLQVEGPMLRDQNWTAYAQRYSQWANSASEPRLVREVLLIDTLPGTELPALDGGAVPVDRLRIRRWNPQTLAFDDAAWTDDLIKTRDLLAGKFVGLQVPRGRQSDDTMHREMSVVTALGDDNTLISPVTLFDMPDRRRAPPHFSFLGYTIVRLDPAVVRGTMLASLASRHFHSNDSEVDYRVAIVHKDDPAQVVWESEPGVAAGIVAAPDVTQTFMGPRPEQMLLFARNLAGGLPVPPPAPTGPPGKIEVQTDKIVVSMVERGARGARGGDPGARVITRGQFGDFDGRWLLMAKHRAGSLEAAVAAVRLRNLMISSSVLLLLTMAVGLIVVSARRAQELARQQMEFVAAVSHELRTPVSVIGAAAGNLADGVVGDPQRVRTYGETIQGEARRLAETVERVLQLAGIAAGRAAAAQQPVNPGDLIHSSLAACRGEIDRAGFTVEESIADHLPDVGGDVAALTSALQNLISNAVKYGGAARWMRVAAKLDPGVGTRQQVLFTVEDRGLGIEADDRKHIFEPFYRGREAVSQQIQGSGLGLNLVMRIAEAHGGRISVSSEPGKGSTFTLALPAVHDRATAATESINLVRQATPSR
jgi:signal transduction histidine kinase